MIKTNKKILLSGGGTGGSVTPLLAIAAYFKNRKDYEFLLLGTKSGVEKKLAREAGLKFKGIFSGKLRRYFSWKNIFDIIFVGLGFIESFFLVMRKRPDLMVSAGSFVSVPVAWACCIFRVPILIIQLDIRPGLANKMMAPLAQKVAVIFEKSLKDYGEKATWVSAPFGGMDTSAATEPGQSAIASSKNTLPQVLVMGGGTGSEMINKIIKSSIDDLTKICELIHISGVGKDQGLKHRSYQSFEFLEHQDLLRIMRESSLVVARAGLGTIIELANLRKPAIVIPMAGTHQEDNARALLEQGAALVLAEDDAIGKNLISSIKKILHNTELQNKLSINIGSFIRHDNGRELSLVIQEILSTK